MTKQKIAALTVLILCTLYIIILIVGTIMNITGQINFNVVNPFYIPFVIPISLFSLVYLNN